MYRVMVVDDEPPFIRAITRQIANFGDEFSVVATAYNGRDALDKLAQADVDVLITDVKMPVMDGIELLREVFERYEHIETVIVSGYQDFAYAKAALKIGVTDYLLKPVERAQFVETMEKIREKLKKRRESAEEALLTDALNRRPVDERQAARLCCGCFRAAVLLCGMYSGVKSLCAGNSGALGHRIRQMIEETGGPGRKWVLEAIPGKLYVAVFGCGAASADEETEEERLAALAQIEPFLTVAYSPRFADIRELAAQVEALERQVKDRALIGVSSVIAPGDSRSGGAAVCSLDAMTLSKLDVLLQSQSAALIAREFDNIASQWEQNRCTQAQVEKAMRQIVQLIDRRYAGREQVGCERAFEAWFPMARDYEDVRKFLAAVVAELSSEGEKTASAADQMVVRLDRYIRDNLDQMITLQNACDLLGLSQPYLSRLIRANKGMSFNEYVTDLKMRKACELLSGEPGILVKDVAAIVGYEDQHYFSKVFKQIVGESPSEYKAKE